MVRLFILLIISIASFCIRTHKEEQHAPQSLSEVYADFVKITPPGWTLDSAGNIFTFTRNDSITYKGYHPNIMTKEPEYRLKFQYKVEVQPQWSAEKQKKADDFNHRIKEKTDSLWHVYYAMGLPVGMDDFYGQNEKEWKLVSDYHHKRDSLELLIIHFPDINSGKYSVFIAGNLPYFGCELVSQPVNIEISDIRDSIAAVFNGNQ